MANMDKLAHISFIVTLLVTTIPLLIIPVTRRIIAYDILCDEFIIIMLCILIYLLVIFFISLFITLPLITKVALETTTSTETESYAIERNICTLSLNNESSQAQNENNNSFSLGIDTSTTESYFYFFTEENSGYKLNKVNADTVYIKETNDIDPKIIINKEQKVSAVVSNPTDIGKSLNLKQEKEETIISEKTETTIYIPVGSIIKSYNPNFN